MSARPGSIRYRYAAVCGLSAAAAATLIACGGSDDAGPPAPVAISGVVADGPLQGAIVCYDLNDNAACDAGEPGATTGADGKYRFEVAADTAGRHAVLADVPTTAIDQDTGAAVGAAFRLSAPATNAAGGQDVFVSALSTVVADRARTSGNPAQQAAADVQAALGLAVSPLVNFIGVGGSADAALAAKALSGVIIQTTLLANMAGVPANQVAALVSEATAGNLGVVASALANSAGATPADKAADAVAAVHAELNLSLATVAAVADALSKPAAPAGAPGPFISVRRFAYTDANNYSFTLFTGDSSQTDAGGRFVAHETRKSLLAGADVPFNRNQAYWNGSNWVVCALEWEVALTNAGTSTTPQTSTYCGASKSESRIAVDDISGRTMRDVVAQIRALPLPDAVGAHTDPISGLPTRWGPDPALLSATATFPAGSQLSQRIQRADIGGTDRIELGGRSSVRWPDDIFRQAVTLEQYSGMPGNLVDAAAVPSNSNTVFVYDLALVDQSDVTLEAFKRFRAGFDVAASKIRFYKCDVRKSDQAALNCATAGDGTLAISTQGDARLMRVASGYPAELESRLKTRRFWAERSGTVSRGARDLEHTRYDQRLNAAAWNALRGELGVPAHAEAVAPAGPGPFRTLRNFTFADSGNYSWRAFDGDSSMLDAQGYFMADEVRETKSAGALVPFVRNRLYWTGTEWHDCPSNGVGVNPVNSKAPFDSTYCKGYHYERGTDVSITLAGRRMSDVVNEIRAYGSKDGTFAYSGWGPNPAVHTQLASAFFPAGSTMTFRGQITKATPIGVATHPTNDKVRVPPANAGDPFDTWPFAASMDEFIAKYAGDLLGGPLNGATAFWVWGYTLAAPPAPEYTATVQIRVAFDANGNKARFWQNNISAATSFTTNYVKLLDTTYTVETLGGFKVLKFAAMPDGFERDFLFQRMFAEREGAVWYAFKDVVPSEASYSIRVNGTAFDALRVALGIN